MKRPVKVLVVIVNLVVGGYLLRLSNGVWIAMQERTQGWNITPLPARPVPRMVLYATLALALQFVLAWLLSPPAISESTRIPPARHSLVGYGARVILCCAGSFVVALVLFFVVIARLDAGVI